MAAMEGGEREQAVFHLVWYSFLAIGKVIAIAAAGGLMTRLRYIAPTAKRDLSNLVMYLFTPCLLFGSVSATVSGIEAGVLAQWWPLLAFPVAYQLVAYGAGNLLLTLLPLPTAISEPPLDAFPASTPVAHARMQLHTKREELSRCLISSLVFWNAGNLPLSLIISITSDVEPFSSDPSSTSRGVAYTSISMTYMSIMTWSLAYNYLNQSNKTNYEELSDTSSASSDCDSKSALLMKDRAESSMWIRVSKEVFTPVTVALVIALFVGLIGPLQRIFYGSGAPLKFVSDLSNTLGSCAVPIILLVLGASLSNGPRTSHMNKWLLVCLILVKLIALPMLAVGMVWLFNRWGLLLDDPLFSLVLVIQATSPSATALVVIAELVDCGSGIMAGLQFWQYIVAVFSITAFIALSLYLFLPPAI